MIDLSKLAKFREVWVGDSEFSTSPGNRPDPICMVAHELRTGRVVKLFGDELCQRRMAPYSVESDALFIAYYASAEFSCHLSLGWPLPAHVLDLFCEFRNLTNGLDTPAGASLLGALAYFGLDAMDGLEKDAMRQLALRGGPWTVEEKGTLLNYCESDVTALRRLLPAMLPKIDVPRAIHRGRYMKAVAHMEHAGVPIDTEALATLRENWDNIQDRLITRVDDDYHVFDGRTFKADRMENYLVCNGINWPRLESGRLALDDATFKTMGAAHPRIEPLRQLRSALSKMRLSDLAVGADGRNRCMLSAYRSRTGRNQPSNSQYIFGASSWLRPLIRPAKGYGLAYVDWAMQEYGIAAALSQDPMMLKGYAEDPYITFAVAAGAAPTWATKVTHGSVREQFKTVSLGTLYGMQEHGLALRTGRPKCIARDLLRLHHGIYKKFWRWSDAVVDHAMLHGSLSTNLGWTIHAGPQVNQRFIRNFLMQANGAEMLRLACDFATEQGITISGPIHDAILIEAPLDDLRAAVEKTQELMAKASEIILGGFRLRSEAKMIRYPERFEDARGARMWETVWGIIAAPPSTAPTTTVGTIISSAKMPLITISSAPRRGAFA